MISTAQSSMISATHSSWSAQFSPPWTAQLSPPWSVQLSLPRSVQLSSPWSAQLSPPWSAELSPPWSAQQRFWRRLIFLIFLFCFYFLITQLRCFSRNQKNYIQNQDLAINHQISSPLLKNSWEFGFKLKCRKMGINTTSYFGNTKSPEN